MSTNFYKNQIIMNNSNSEYPLDFSGQKMEVLDLSKPRVSEQYYYGATSPDNCHSSSSPMSSSSENVATIRAISPTTYVTKYRESQNGIVDRPSFVPEANAVSRSPHNRNYTTCFPGTEHLGPLVLHAALQQQILIKQNCPDVDNNNKNDQSGHMSDTGSDGGKSTNALPIYPLIAPGRDGKVTRPFKAYPKDPLSLSAGFTAVDSFLDTQSAEKYTMFRQKMLEQICAANGGQATVSNPKMRRTVNTNNNYVGEEDKDNSYTERRRKNNAAAKKSRDRRRIKEDEIAIRAAYLERENLELKFELAASKKQLEALGVLSTTQNKNNKQVNTKSN